MKNIIGYIRVSTNTQNINVQKHEIAKYARIKRLHVNNWIIEKCSGNSRNRKINDIYYIVNRKDILIITEVSRVGRNTKAVIKMLKDFLNAGISIHFVRHKLIVSYPNRYFNIKISRLVEAAEIEKGLVSSRTKAALSEAKMRGVILGNPNLKPSNDKKHEKAQQFAEKLRPLIISLIKSNLNQREIIKVFNDCNLPAREGGKWHLISLQRVLKRLNI